MKAIAFIKNNPLLVCLLVIGTVLRLYRLDFQSVWLDEVHTLNDANPANSLAQVHASIVAADPHPPLYFYVIHFMFKIFGYTPVVARLFSVVIGIYGIYAIFQLGKEMFSPKVGLIAAMLLTLSSYHIYYSQEARPYAMLCLFTTLSFLYLVRYLKLPTRRNAILYGVFTALMLYGHFFSLFAVLGQMAILLFFAVIAKPENRKSFLINSAIAGLVTLVLFLPSIKIFIAAMEIKSFWIPYPTPDVYTAMYKEFFGNSEMLMFVFGFMAILYFIRLSKEKEQPLQYESVVTNKNVLAFVVLAAWIVIVLLVPLIRSYTSIPMLITRYFINVFPAVLIVIAVGLTQFKNQIIRWSFIAMLFVFSLTELIVIKKYYKTVTKTQFREATQFIADNNNRNEPVVTSLAWYFNYFLNNDVYKFTIVDKPLDGYVQEMMQDPSKQKAFWYVDAHNRPYKVTPQTQQFLDAHFMVENSIDLYDIWSKHYVPLGQAQPIDISKFKDLKPYNGDQLNFSIEAAEQKDGKVKVSGWAYFTDQESVGTSITLVLIKDGKAIPLPTQKVSRHDVTDYFKSKYNIDNSGFAVDAAIADLQPGVYQLGVYATNRQTKKEALNVSDKTVQK